MSKADKGTPKDLSKKMKSKGLKKLKWFCQMCSKQCGDQNGFKRHCESESHQRQLLLFAENQSSYLKEFSKDFEINFMHIFKHSFGGKRVRANVIYQEYIRDRGHVHMNATIWHTLGGFVQYLGESGKCRIDENEKGWHIQLIDQEEEMRKQKLVDRVKQERTDDDRMAELLQRQIERDQAKTGNEVLKEAELKEFVRENEEHKIKFELVPLKPNKDKLILPKLEPSTSNEDVKPRKELLDVKPVIKKKPTERKRTALDELREEEERFKERKNRKDYWLHSGIIVKIVSRKAGDKFYKQKGEVTKVIDKYTAEVTLPTGEVVEFDQNRLETVIPAIGHEMLIVNGAYRGEIAELEDINQDRYLLSLRISEGTKNGRVVQVSYEDASKLA